jgi:c-di-GMP-binding flagellar brake protein YcgR
VSGPDDKRKYHRFMALLELRVLPGERIPADLRVATIDISVGGLRCASNRSLDANLNLKLTLTLVGGDLRDPLPIDADAMVLRCTESRTAPEHRRYEVALEFTRMDAQDRRRLQNYLNSL